MELKELKCPNCKGKIKVEDGKNKVKCEYCETEFQVSDLEERNQKLKEKVVEETILKPVASARKQAKYFFMIFIPIFILFFGFIVYQIVSSTIEFNNRKNEINNEMLQNKVEEEYNKTIKELEREANSFNFEIESYAGRQAEIFVQSLLTKVITNNKKNERKIIVSHEGTETTDPSEITNIKNSMPEHSYYDISFDYDDSGFIYKLTMTNLN